jgi:hypothetical protein
MCWLSVTTISDHSQTLTVCFSREGRFAVESCIETKKDVCVRQMVWYHGKCAACGVGKNHKNFKGRRSGYAITDPCYVVLRKRRKAKDDRLCCRCYEAHLANFPKEPITPTTVKATNHRSSMSTVSDLDGVGWKEPKSERVAKLSCMDPNGTPVLPLQLHVKKIEELNDAMRSEQLELIACQKQFADEQMDTM